MRNNHTTHSDAFNNNGRSLPPIGYSQLSTGSMPTGFRPENGPKTGIGEKLLSLFGLQKQPREPVVQLTLSDQKKILASYIETELAKHIEKLGVQEEALAVLEQERLALKDLGHQLSADPQTPRSRLDDLAEEWDDLCLQIEKRENAHKPLAEQKRLAQSLIRDLRNPDMGGDLGNLIQQALELLENAHTNQGDLHGEVRDQRSRWRNIGREPGTNGRPSVEVEAYDQDKEARTSRFLAECHAPEGRVSPTQNPFRQRRGVGGEA
jgi:hypothetical protein